MSPGSAPPRFIGSFPRADIVLDPQLPEIALVGRSNVGKSSLLNAVAGRRIARVSAEPGKTRLLNVYLWEGRRALGVGHGEADAHVPRPPPHALYLLDLPGYGYARASKPEREGFRRLVAAALERPRLAGVVWLLDARRDPSAEDHLVQQVLARRRTDVLAALTKIDKLGRAARAGREADICAALGLDRDQAIATSAKTGEGIAELREAITGFIAEVE